MIKQLILEIGTGGKREIEGSVTLDIREMDGVDVVADARVFGKYNGSRVRPSKWGPPRVKIYS